MPAGKGTVAAFALAAATVAGTGVSAHRLDECLQAARIGIQPDRAAIELDLTPGAAAAGAMIASIDRDGDGLFSAAEQRAYAGAVLADIVLEVDGEALQIGGATSAFADVAALRQGEGAVRLRTSVDLPRLAAGEHQLLFRNRHAAEGSVYLANALVPDSDRVAVTGQRRDSAQRELTIDYVLSPDRPLTAAAVWMGGALFAVLLAAAWRRPKGGAWRAALRQS